MRGWNLKCGDLLKLCPEVVWDAWDFARLLGDLFSEDDADELIEVHVSQLDRLAGLDVCQFGFLETP
jgi:hypothetical protein